MNAGARYKGRLAWWISLIVLCVGTLFALYIYDSSKSFWLGKPDLKMTIVAIAVVASCATGFVMVSIWRAVDIGANPKFLLLNLLLIPIPFWVIALGFLPSKADGKDSPFNKLKRLVWIALAVLMAASAAYLVYTLKFRTPADYRLKTEVRGDAASENDNLPTWQECYARGIAYFKEIDAYPYLRTTGENAQDVASTRCSRSRLAFGR